jgi:hypothetical protein
MKKAPFTGSFFHANETITSPIEGRGYREGMPGYTGRQARISLKGEVSDHKGISDENRQDGEILDGHTILPENITLQCQYVEGFT